MKLKYLKTFEGYKLEPHRNYEEREEIYKQKYIKLFNTEVINGNLDLSDLKIKDFLYTDLHKIKEINGNLIIRNNTFLTSLFPLEKVNNIHIYNTNIKKLGNIKEVTGYFYCYNSQLTSLEGAPKKVNGNFICPNNKLISLKGVLKEINGSFSCSHNQLISLEGAPKKVNGNFYCDNNPALTEKDIEWLKQNCNIKGKIIWK